MASPWLLVEEAHGCVFRWNEPANFLSWQRESTPGELADLDAARLFDVRSTVSPPRWRVPGQGAVRREPRPLVEAVRALCLQMDRRLPDESVMNARDSVELLDQTLDSAVGMDQCPSPPPREARPARRRSKPSPSPSPRVGGGGGGARRPRGGDVSKRLHGLHGQQQERLARRAAVEERQMFSPRTNLSSPRSPMVRSPAGSSVASSPKRRVSADQARRTSDKLYRQARAKEAKVKEMQQQKREQEMQGLFTPRTVKPAARRETPAEAREMQMEAGERLHNEAIAKQTLLKEKRERKLQEEVAKLTFKPDLFEDRPGKFQSAEASGYVESPVGDRLHDWAMRKGEEKQKARQAQAKTAQQRMDHEGEHAVMSAGSREATVKIGTNHVKRNDAWLAKRARNHKDAVKSETEEFRKVGKRTTLREPKAERDRKRDEWVATMDGRLVDSRERAEAKRMAQEEKELAEVTGTPEISEKARELKRGKEDYRKGTAISERKRPGSTGADADTDPGSWIEVEAAYQRRVVAAEAEKHRLHSVAWYKCKHDAAQTEKDAAQEELKQKVADEIISKQRMAQAGVRKLAIGQLRPKLERLVVGGYEEESDDPDLLELLSTHDDLEWGEVEVMILQKLTLYMALTPVTDAKGHEWLKAEYDDGTPVLTEDANTVAMIDMAQLDGALEDPQAFLKDLVEQMEDSTNKSVRRPRPSSVAPVLKADERCVEERMFAWAEQREATRTHKAEQALQEQIISLAASQSFQGQPSNLLANEDSRIFRHTEASVGKDKLTVVLSRSEGSKAQVHRYEPGQGWGDDLGGVDQARAAEEAVLTAAAKTAREDAMPKLDHSFTNHPGKDGMARHARKVLKSPPVFFDTAAPAGEVSSIVPAQAQTLNASGHEVAALAFSFRVDHPLDGTFLTDRSRSFAPLPVPETASPKTGMPKRSPKKRATPLPKANGGGLGLTLPEYLPPPSRRAREKPKVDLKDKERQRKLAESSRKREQEKQEAVEKKESLKWEAREKARRKKEAAADAKKKKAGRAADNRQEDDLARAAAKGAGSAAEQAAIIAAEAQDAAGQDAAKIAAMQERTKMVQEALAVGQEHEQEQEQVDDDSGEGEGETMAIKCPEGVGEGELVTVETPDGRELEVQVPEGVLPGATFDVFVGQSGSGELLQANAAAEAEALAAARLKIAQVAAVVQSDFDEEERSAVAALAEAEEQRAAEIEAVAVAAEAEAEAQAAAKAKAKAKSAVEAERKAAEAETDALNIRRVKDVAVAQKAEAAKVAAEAEEAARVAAETSAAEEAARAAAEEAKMKAERQEAAAAEAVKNGPTFGELAGLLDGLMGVDNDDDDSSSSGGAGLDSDDDARPEPQPSEVDDLDFDDLAGLLGEDEDEEDEEDEEPVNALLMEIDCPDGSSPGDIVEVMSPRGAIDVEVPAGVQPGESFTCELPADEADAAEAAEAAAEEEEEVAVEVGEEADGVADLAAAELEPEQQAKKSKKPTKSNGRRYSVSMQQGASDLADFLQVIDQEEQHDETNPEASDFISVSCPDGVAEGDSLYVTTLDGREINVDVPEGVKPGDDFEVYVGLEEVEVTVTVPEGSAPGDEITIETPDGREVVVEVPEGCLEGQDFTAAV